MRFDPEKHHRRSIRLPEYDYAGPGAYFVTICTQGRVCLFGEVVNHTMVPNDAGRMLQTAWDELPDRFPGVDIDAFVVMPNHIHLIASAGEGLQPVIRDFKRFTSRAIHDRLKEDGRRTPLDSLTRATEAGRRRRGELGMWEPGFHPQALPTRDRFDQKLAYLHDNPVRKGLVRRPEDWWYSSAALYAGTGPGCLDVAPIEF